MTDEQVSDADVRRDLNNLRKNVETIIEAFREDWLTGARTCCSRASQRRRFPPCAGVRPDATRHRRPSGRPPGLIGLRKDGRTQGRLQLERSSRALTESRRFPPRRTPSPDAFLRHLRENADPHRQDRPTAAKNPKILQCSQESVMMSIMQAAELGLEPADSLARGYLDHDGQPPMVIPDTVD